MYVQSLIYHRLELTSLTYRTRPRLSIIQINRVAVRFAPYRDISRPQETDLIFVPSYREISMFFVRFISFILLNPLLPVQMHALSWSFPFSVFRYRLRQSFSF